MRQGTQTVLALLAAVVLASVSLTFAARGATGPADTLFEPQVRRRGLVEMGSDWPSPEYVRDHIRQMERRPFDGVVVNLQVPRSGFDTQAPWTLSAFATVPMDRADLRLPVLESIRWGRFRENFLFVFAHDWWTRDMDWFDDAQWGVIGANAQLTGEAVAAGGFRGIVFDPEAYFEPDVWRMPALAPGTTEADVRATVRRRGREYMEALQAARGDVTVVCLGLFSIALHADYSLLADFGVGLLEGANPGSIVSDTPETTYWARRSMDLYWSHGSSHQRARDLVPPELADRLADRFRADSIIYLDAIYATDATWDRARMLTQNVYHGLAATDAVTFVWSDTYMPIWLGPGASGQDIPNWWTGENLPKGAMRAVRAARARLDRGRTLDFSFHQDAGGAVVEAHEPSVRIVSVNGGRPPRTGVPFAVDVRVRGAPWDSIVPYADGVTLGQSWTAAAPRVSVPLAPLGEGVHTVMVEMYRFDPYSSVSSAPVTIRVAPAPPR